MIRSVSIVFAMLLLSSAASAQYPPHSAAEERACRGDARHFCRDDLSDSFRVSSCLQMHQSQLHRGCRAVMQNRGM